jgi:hypothetical protein
VLTQTGLTDKVISYTGMSNANEQHTLAPVTLLDLTKMELLLLKHGVINLL